MPQGPDKFLDPYSSLHELAADPARQAVSTIRAYIYQVWWSVDAWLQLYSADDVIFLEGAEDLDKVNADGATAGQIKNEAAGISLNNQRAHEALENFWTLREREPDRRVDFHYIATASAATEVAGYGRLGHRFVWHRYCVDPELPE